MSVISEYAKITSPDSACILYMMKTDGSPIANIDRYIEWPDFLTAVQSGLTYPPPVGAFREQKPGEPTPATLWSGTSWTNISEKAWRYELSVSGWVDRADVHAWSEADYAATDTVIGGTYDGETVNTVFNPEGKFECIEGTRESGVTAKTFGEGWDADAGQQITGGFLGDGSGTTASGAFTKGSTSGGGRSGTTGLYAPFTFDSADSVSPNAAKTNEYETRPEYFSKRVWTRTA